MSSRSRKRRKTRGAARGGTPPVSARPKRPEAPAPAPRPKEQRPPAPWGNFPLVELAVLFGLVMLVIGAVERNVLIVATGLMVGAAAGLELSVREHFNGYRSHTTLLAGSAFVATVGVLFYATGLILAICLGIGAIVFAAVALWLRRAFQRASGGLSFKFGGLRG